MTVTLRGRPLALSALEYRLLAYLALQPGRVTPPTVLLEHLYGDDDAREANALEALVARLRRKLGPGIVGTRRGLRLLPRGRRRGRAPTVSRRSLRLRLLFVGAAALAATLTVAALGLALLFERHVERRAVAELSARLDQIAAGLDTGPGSGPERVTCGPPPIPAIGQPAVGRLLAARDADRDARARARSGTRPSTCSPRRCRAIRTSASCA